MPATRRAILLGAALTRPQVDYGRGGHQMSYWRRMAPAQLRFVGAHLAG